MSLFPPSAPSNYFKCTFPERQGKDHHGLPGIWTYWEGTLLFPKGRDTFPFVQKSRNLKTAEPGLGQRSATRRAQRQEVLLPGRAPCWVRGPHDPMTRVACPFHNPMLRAPGDLCVQRKASSKREGLPGHKAQGVHGLFCPRNSWQTGVCGSQGLRSARSRRHTEPRVLATTWSLVPHQQKHSTLLQESQNSVGGLRDGAVTPRCGKATCSLPA